MEFIDLGRKDYRQTWDLQNELQTKIIAGKLHAEHVEPCVLLVEHTPVYTLGRNGNANNLLINEERLKENGAEAIKVDRGGDITFHGPGQLVVYPIIDIERYKLGLKDYIYNLEEIVIMSIKEFGLEGARIYGATGVWIEKDSPYARKICAIGVKCSHYVTMHGFALNVNVNLNYFNYINPCGFVDKGVTSIENELRKTITIDEVKPIIIKYFNYLFGSV
jgi:lipoyl(octanoyl) transferase